MATVVYRVLLLLALLWVGYGLQSVAQAVFALGDACLAEPAADGTVQDGDGATEEPPQILKPVLRGST